MLLIDIEEYRIVFLKLMYITNNPQVALIAEKYGVDRIWIDLETLGKEERQKNMDTVKSNHKIEDITLIKPMLSSAELLVRVNPWNETSPREIEEVIAAGADMIMLPMWKDAETVQKFVSQVRGRAKTTLLLETKEAVECIDSVLDCTEFNEIHIGLNDLHLSYGLSFMFELLSNGTVEMLCNKFKKKCIPYGFGGIAKIGDGLLPAEKIIMEHYRMGSTRAILSRSFCNTDIVKNLEDIDSCFKNNMRDLINYENNMMLCTEKEYKENQRDIESIVKSIISKNKED